MIKTGLKQRQTQVDLASRPQGGATGLVLGPGPVVTGLESWSKLNCSNVLSNGWSGVRCQRWCLTLLKPENTQCFSKRVIQIWFRRSRIWVKHQPCPSVFERLFMVLVRNVHEQHRRGFVVSHGCIYATKKPVKVVMKMTEVNSNITRPMYVDENNCLRSKGNQRTLWFAPPGSFLMTSWGIQLVFCWFSGLQIFLVQALDEPWCDLNQ